MNKIVIVGLLACGLMFTQWAQAEFYTVQTVSTQVVDPALPALPDISGYNRNAILQKQAQWQKPAHITFERMINNVATRKFFKGGKLGMWAQKQGQFPKAIYVHDGILTLPALHKAMPDALVKLNKQQYLLRFPIVVMNHAAFAIAPGEELLLSHERGSFLVNAGDVFIVDGALRGWSEQTNSPAKYNGKKEEYRPFYIGWSGSETYAYGSLIESLGSLNSKAYGFTLSTYSEQDEMYAPLTLNRLQHPRGWLVNNRVTDMFYGFYSYEANDVVLVGNKYYDNIYYGIDPHDRSHHLIIANNEVWGTKVRHGIIGSRDVSGAFIFGNVSHDNNQAGIMLDRASNHNVVMQNSSYNNGSDGLAVYESHHNLIADNRFYNNQHHGIRFRNSLDVTLKDNLILQNGHYGIYGYLSDLSAHAPLPGHEARDLKLDPYEMRGSGYISGGVIALNGSGALFTTGLEAVEIGKLALDENGKRREITLGGDLVPYTDVISTVWYGDVNEVLFSRAVSTKRSNAHNSVSLEVANE